MRAVSALDPWQDKRSPAMLRKAHHHFAIVLLAALLALPASGAEEVVIDNPLDTVWEFVEQLIDALSDEGPEANTECQEAPCDEFGGGIEPTG